jgi:hypothetical protein
MIGRPDLLDERSLPGLEVVQLTSDWLPCSHVYMESQVFTPDSRRLILHRGADAHGKGNRLPQHQFLRCDINDGGSLHPMTDEIGATAACVSPDGRHMYYFVDESQINGGRITLKRVNIDGTGRCTIRVLDAPLPPVKVRPSVLYPKSTISSDGRRIATSAFLGDGHDDDAPYGVLVWEVTTGEVHLVAMGPTFCNTHPQYCRSKDPVASHDLMIQENHGNAHDARGSIRVLVSGPGADIHIIRDDGTNWRSLPWGRHETEMCQGHQCWRGASTWAITSTSEPGGQHLIESQPYAGADHLGSGAAGPVIRNRLTCDDPSPHYYHFATDRAGGRLITDHFTRGTSPKLWLMELGQPGVEPIRQRHYLLDTRSSNSKDTHVHPFLSPDGKMGFFNSDESGRLQAYMVRGWA